MNNVALVGRLATEIKVKENENGKVGYFTIAVKRTKEKADFISITVFDNTATFIEKYISVGDLISVSAKVRSNSYETEEGDRRYTISIVSSDVQLLHKKKNVIAEDDVYQNEESEELTAEEDGIYYDADNLPF